MHVLGLPISSIDLTKGHQQTTERIWLKSVLLNYDDITWGGISDFRPAVPLKKPQP